MAFRNKGATSQEVPKSQVLAILPPLLAPLPIDLGLHTMRDVKKKSLLQEIEEGELIPQKGTKQQKTAKDPKDKGLHSWTAEKSRTWSRCAYHSVCGRLG